MNQLWHLITKTEALRELQSGVEGLTATTAAERLKQYGANELVERGGRSPFRILWEQLTATMVLILIAAGVMSVLLNKPFEAVAIFAIVILFTLFGFFQEYRAERAMAALKKLAMPIVRVKRNGEAKELTARELVPGDVVLLEAGNMVPADLRLLESVSLKIQEAALTGESEAVEKNIEPLTQGDAPLGDRVNMAYMGTLVSYGRGMGVVTATGMKTELGNIADMLQKVSDSMTPLQKRLDDVGKMLAIAGVLVAVVIALVDLIFRAQPVSEVLLTAVSVAVAIVPEGLPAVVTITLAIGAQRMLKRNALIRKLPAVETLGSVTVICSDKTGTLTENRMTVTLLDVAGHRLDLTEEVMHRVPSLSAHAPSLKMPSDYASSLTVLLSGGALCNDATLKIVEGGKRHETLGDPTEGALVVAAAQFGIWQDDLKTQFPRVGELPFDSDRKRMTTVHNLAAPLAKEGSPLLAFAAQGNYLAVTKGAMDTLLTVTKSVWVNDKVEELNDLWRERLTAANGQMAKNGMRVLGIAVRSLKNLQEKFEERDLIFVGLVGIIDPPRAEVKDAVAICKTAGIRPVMITGDHPLTARHIAEQLGIYVSGDVVTGQTLSAMNDEQLDAIVEKTAVYARVSPEHKLRIVEALKRKGQVVAMTGDGVNDAPALKKADIGVAMGITGTDVSKEASQMVLRDDNFATIVAAVEEGRVIYDNLRKFIKFSIGGNIGKVAVVMVGPFINLLPAASLPQQTVFPLQLLWLNLLTDGLLGLGLGSEPAEKDVMQRPPVSPKEGVFSRGLGGSILRTGAAIAVVSLGLGYWQQQLGNSNWQTMIFVTLAFTQIGQALGIRSDRDSLFKEGLFTNRTLIAMIVIIFILQAAAVYLPFLQTFLRTTPLTLADWLWCLGAGVLMLVMLEIEKMLRRD